jgi:hypothetical protein
MMHIDDGVGDALHPGPSQPLQRKVQQGTTAHRTQGLGQLMGQRRQPGAASRRQHHGSDIGHRL